MSIRNKVLQATGAVVVGLALSIAQYHEGLVTKAAPDPVGIPTVCFGHTEGVKLGMELSEQECLVILGQDMDIAFASVDRLVKVPMTYERRQALADFVFNAGQGNFAKSTLLKKLNAGDTWGACAELSKWVYAGGKKLAGLVKRRAVERKYCEMGLLQN